MTNKQFIPVGKITAPVGIKGEVRVYSYFDDFEAVRSLKTLYNNETEYKIESARVQGSMLVFKLSGINDRNGAEAMRNIELCAEKSDIKLAKDSFLDADIIGMDAAGEDGVVIGKVTNILHNSAQDLFEITKTDGAAFLLPAVKAFVINMDFDNNLMTVRLIEGIDSL